MTHFKAGDRLICKPGYTNSSLNLHYGGAGYKEGKIIIVDHLNDLETVVWPTDNGSYGIFIKALDYAPNEHTNESTNVDYDIY